MKAGKNCRLPLLFLLFCALSLSGCGLLGGGDEGQSQQARTESVKKAQEELTAAQIKLTQTQEAEKKATSDAAAAADEEDKAREKADKFRADTTKDGKDPDDERVAPKTVAAAREYKGAQKKADSAREADSAAKAGVQAARDKVTEAAKKLEDARNPGTSLFPAWLLYALAAFVGVVALAAIGLLLKKFLADSRDRRQLAFNSVTAGQEGSAKRLGSLIADLGQKVDDHFSRQSKEAVAVSERLTTLRQEVEALRITLNALATQPFFPGGYQGAGEGKEKPAFPVSAVEYLNREGRNATRVKSDALNDILVKASDGTGEMALVEDRSAPGLLYVVPTVGSFKTKQDFYGYYEKYFDCDRPNGGEVWINKLATVKQVNGGWELREKGELEVR